MRRAHRCGWTLAITLTLAAGAPWLRAQQQFGDCRTRCITLARDSIALSQRIATIETQIHTYQNLLRHIGTSSAKSGAQHHIDQLEAQEAPIVNQLRAKTASLARCRSTRSASGRHFFIGFIYIGLADGGDFSNGPYVVTLTRDKPIFLNFSANGCVALASFPGLHATQAEGTGTETIDLAPISADVPPPGGFDTGSGIVNGLLMPLHVGFKPDPSSLDTFVDLPLVFSADPHLAIHGQPCGGSLASGHWVTLSAVTTISSPNAAINGKDMCIMMAGSLDPAP